MYLSRESTEQNQQRLLQVIAQAEFKVYEQSFIFEELPLSDFPSKANPAALAFVRDEQVWSQLVCSSNSDGELFKLFSFHFAENLDNSGFVGWLATHLKQEIGTGVFVVCGQNSNRGGIFDYWGCPLEVAEIVLREVEELIEQGKELVN